MGRIHTSLTFGEYFWKDIDLNGKVVLDAGTGFGITTLEIAKRMNAQKQIGKIISIDIDLESFKLAEKLLKLYGLQDMVTFIKADLAAMPQIETESIDIILSTRTLSDINRFPCRLIRAISEFYRVLKRGGRIVLSDECPRLTPFSSEEDIAVSRWNLAKALSHLTGKPHSHEVDPEDLEFMMKLVGFRGCEWTTFEGKKIPERRIRHFVRRAKEMASDIRDIKLRDAFYNAIENIQEAFQKKGGVFPPKYVIHAVK